jgi:hypothetical protein
VGADPSYQSAESAEPAEAAEAALAPLFALLLVRGRGAGAGLSAEFALLTRRGAGAGLLAESAALARRGAAAGLFALCALAATGESTADAPGESADSGDGSARRSRTSPSGVGASAGESLAPEARLID